MISSSIQEEAARLDAADPLRGFRDEFYLPYDANGKPLTYLCGHSLGLQPRSARTYVNEVLDDWQRLGVEGHFTAKNPWLTYHERLSHGLAALAGASEREVIAMNSLSVNLHLLLASFYRPTRERYKILIERNAFPSDRYAVRSQIAWHGFDPVDSLIEATPREGVAMLHHGDLCALIEREGAKIAMVLLPGVQYLTGQRFDIASIATVARKQGCTVGFDLAHAIGNVPLALHDSDVDFAVWCSYKYLNGGPGAIGGAFVHERHAERFSLPRLAGWWGHDQATRFTMPDKFIPLTGARGWQVSNPPILSMAPLAASLEVFARADFARLQEKSRSLTQFLARYIEQHLGDRVKIITPKDSAARGCQLSMAFNETSVQSRRVHERLIAAGVICDWREPNVLRVATAPLYNTYKEAGKLVEILQEILA
ncbi:MAG TPA: kynureninase [Steroidobacteraceae bacterium]|nr:kynureninase [Steroidobacteraceae bacterium]